MVKAKPNQKIHVSQLDTALDKLSQLDEKPVEELTLRESIYFLRDKLKSALKKGYSYDDLSEILAEQEILISAATLKLYLTDSSKKSSDKRKRINSASSSKSTSTSNDKLSTNVTDLIEDKKSLHRDDEFNSMNDSTDSKQAVKSSSTTRRSSSTANSKKAKANSQSIGNRSNSILTNVLSGRSDNLESEFNDF